MSCIAHELEYVEIDQNTTTGACELLILGRYIDVDRTPYVTLSYGKSFNIFVAYLKLELSSEGTACDAIGIEFPLDMRLC